MVDRARYMTADQFVEYAQQPENADRLLELVNGEIVEKVLTEEHGVIVMNIGSPMRTFVNEHKLGRVSTEGLHRSPDDDQNAVLPDVSFRSNRSVVYPQFFGVTTAHAARLTGRA